MASESIMTQEEEAEERERKDGRGHVYIEVSKM
jgi:hypothetical protein